MNLNNLSNESLANLTLLWETSIRNPELRIRIEQILRQKITTNNPYSIERIYDICSRGASTVKFIPTTDSYKLYGQYITLINLNLTSEQEKGIIERMIKNPPIETYGLVKAKILNSGSDENEDNVKMIVFNTYEILVIEQ